MSACGQLSFQDAASPLMSHLISFHDHSMIILTLMMTLISLAMLSLMLNKLTSVYLFEAQYIETIWTILPVLTLLFLALPSLRILYLMEESSDPLITLKTIGHQWYWSYEYSDFTNIEFDSYMIPSENLLLGQFRLLEVDNRVILPIQTDIRIMVTAADVIHAWAIPALGVKIDAIPGRLNQTNMLISRPGLFYGQCSEICGANHSFMPIAIEAINPPTFIKWVSSL